MGKVIAFPNLSLADVPAQFRRLADAYERHSDTKVQVVLIEYQPETAHLEVYGLGEGTDAGVSLSMALEAAEQLKKGILGL